MEDKVKKIMSEIFVCEYDDINIDTNIDSLNNWDSLQHIIFIANLEEAFQVEFTPDEIAQMISFVKIIEIVKKHVIN